MLLNEMLRNVVWHWNFTIRCNGGQIIIFKSICINNAFVHPLKCLPTTYVKREKVIFSLGPKILFTGGPYITQYTRTRRQKDPVRMRPQERPDSKEEPLFRVGEGIPKTGGTGMRGCGRYVSKQQDVLFCESIQIHVWGSCGHCCDQI